MWWRWALVVIYLLAFSGSAYIAAEKGWWEISAIYLVGVPLFILWFRRQPDISRPKRVD